MLGHEFFLGEKFVAADEDFVAGFEACCYDAFLWFYGEEDLVQGTKDFVDFADGGLCFKGDKVVSFGCFRGGCGSSVFLLFSSWLRKNVAGLVASGIGGLALFSR